MCEVLRSFLWAVLAFLTMSQEGYITVMLTLLGLMLAVLAIGLALAAFWGWAGIKEAATKAATDAMKGLPELKGEMLELKVQLEGIIGSWEVLRTQSVKGYASKPVASTSNIGVQPKPSVAPPYPQGGGGTKNVSPAPAAPAADSGDADTDADSS